jgi:hypothetical protein
MRKMSTKWKAKGNLHLELEFFADLDEEVHSARAAASDLEESLSRRVTDASLAKCFVGECSTRIRRLCTTSAGSSRRSSKKRFGAGLSAGSDRASLCYSRI